MIDYIPFLITGLAFGLSYINKSSIAMAVKTTAEFMNKKSEQQENLLWRALSLNTNSPFYGTENKSEIPKTPVLTGIDEIKTMLSDLISEVQLNTADITYVKNELHRIDEIKVNKPI